MRQAISSFWQGFGSIFSIQPVDPGPMQFRFRGYDIASISVEEALAQDWKAIGHDYERAIEQLAPHGRKANHRRRKRAAR